MTHPAERCNLSFPSASRRLVLAVGLVLCGTLVVAAPGHATAPAGASPTTAEGWPPPEILDDPPGIPARPVIGAPRAAAISFGRFTSVQVNVDGNGADIPGDAANEPSIAVDPTNHNLMAIGWRQFDTIASNFREAGYGYTSDGGQTWTKGEIEPGFFRSDPVLVSDANGKFFYSSLTNVGGFNVRFFPSTDGGKTWGASVFANGGDKQWFTIDRTGGMGHHHFYQAWSTASNPTPPNTFNRSVDGGATFQAPTQIPNSPVWGTLDVASDGTLYLVGTSGPGGTIYVSRSTNAKNALASPTFTTSAVNLGGTIQTGGPNPAGLLGQLWIAVDRSGGSRDGWVYVLASVRTPSDRMDVHFIRSTDGGATWSTPVRVNDDPMGNGAWQWFGTMSVSPDGRIDAVWNDSRTTGDSSMVALHYSFSTDGGSTWSANEQASPVWNSRIGWPNQSKIGDYYHMVSDNSGADLAWSATFSGGQDVYYTRIPYQSATAVAEPSRPFRLHAAEPNPFAATTTIRFDTPAELRVRLTVFDLAGRRVATLVDGRVGAGSHVARWAGTDAGGRPLGAGVYLYRLEAGGFSTTRRLMLLR